MLIEPRRSLAALMLSIAWCNTSVAAGKSVPGTEYLRITMEAPGYGGRDAADDRWLVYLEGYIDTGATARLERALDGQRVRSAVVYFDSPGGHVVEAMALGRMLRERRFATGVGVRSPSVALPRAGHCYSACPVAYAGGVRRSLEPGSVLGVHRAENSVPLPDEMAFQHFVSEQTSNYLAEMGISAELVMIMSKVPHDTIRELTADEAVGLGLVHDAGAVDESLPQRR
jgi:hypothetical protein